MRLRCLCTPPCGRFNPLRPLAVALLTVMACGFYAARPSDAYAIGGPSNLAPPVIGGNLVEGGRLTAHPGTWSGLPALSYSYEWQRCSNPDPSSCAATGVAGAAYALTPADTGSWLRITVSVVNSDGLATANSELAGPVTTAPLNPAIASRNISWPVISGEPRIGNLLDASEGLWYAPPDASFRFQWRRCGNDGCAEIAGAVAPYYVPTYLDQGAQLQVVVMPMSVTPLLPALGPVASELTPPAVCDSPDGSTTCGPAPCEPPYYKPGAASVTLLPPVAVQPDRVTLTWTGSGGQYFRAYEIHRSMNPSFEPGPATLLARFEDQTASSYTDTSVAREASYSYKVVLITTCVELRSDEQRVQLPGEGYTTRNVYGPASTQATYIRASASDQTSQCVNSGAEGTLLVGADSQTVYRSLLRLDLSHVPANAQITDARLVLWSRSAATAELTVSALVRDWQEGSGRGTCAGDGATWQQARTGSAWSSPGGDVDPDTWGSGEGEHDPYQPSRIEVSITGLVRAWVGGGRPNYGLMLRATKEASAPGVFSFLSDETASASQTPVLAVRYTVVTTTEQEHNPDSRPYEPTGSAPSICSNSDVRTQQGQVPVPANDPSAHIITACLSESAKAIEFRNDDGRWTIYLECDGPVGNGQTVGPGYIAKFVEERRGGVQRIFADGRAMVRLGAYPHIADIGGLGIFGYHAARGQPNRSAASNDPADPTIEARGEGQIPAPRGRLLREGRSS